jgi:hypothetical protein
MHEAWFLRATCPLFFHQILVEIDLLPSMRPEV